MLILKILKPFKKQKIDERKKQWIKIVFGIVLALGYGGLQYLNVNVSEVIYALGMLL